MPFTVGQRVSKTTNPNDRGTIQAIGGAFGGYQFYQVLMDNSSLQMISEVEIQPEVIVKTAYDLLRLGTLGDFRDFGLTSTIYKVRNKTSNTISSLKAARTIFMPYQFKPLVKFLKSNNRRILIADEVGLGKTIEAGYILMELAARNMLRNCLVVCTKSLQEKWQSELHYKFNFPFKIYETTSQFLDDVNADVNANRKRIFGILSYSKVRNSDLQDFFDTDNYQFDLVICDEAHHVRNSNQQHAGVERLTRNAGAVVFLTATPIMTDLSNLYHLVKLLDPKKYINESVFVHAVNMNKPFVRALTRLRNGDVSCQVIAAELLNDKVSKRFLIGDETFYFGEQNIQEYFSSDGLFNRTIERLMSGVQDVQEKVQLQNDLMELNSLNYIYSRTKKNEVRKEDTAVVRNPHTIRVTLGEEERVVYDETMRQSDSEHPFAILNKKRQMASSIPAYLEDESAITSGTLTPMYQDTKFDFLVNYVLENVVKRESKKIIIFSFYRKTLLYLHYMLQSHGYHAAIIYGGIQNRDQVIDSFKKSVDVKILLSSEVGSEGIDLQFCDTIVNYDLPWNPMVIEQRIGRIDRVGQKSKVITIYNLIIEDSIEEKIYDRLYARIRLFEESIGDLEAILGENESLTKLLEDGIGKLFNSTLTSDQQDVLLDQIEQAIARERLQIDLIKGELEGAFANDMHFQDEVNRIIRTKRYLTEREVELFVLSLQRNILPNVRFEKLHSDQTKWVLHLAGNTLASTFFTFLEQNLDSENSNPELWYLFRRFKTTYYASDQILFTCFQNTGMMDTKVEYISAFHPLVNAIANYYTANSLHTNLAFKASLALNKVKHLGLNQGYYIIASLIFTVKRFEVKTKIGEFEIMHHFLIDLNSENLTFLSDDISASLVGELEENAEALTEFFQFPAELLQVLQNEIMRSTIEKQYALHEDEVLKHISSVKRRAQQELDYWRSKLKHLEEQMLTAGRNIRNRKAELEIEKKIEHLEDAMVDASIDIQNKLVSLTLMEIPDEI